LRHASKRSFSPQITDTLQALGEGVPYALFGDTPMFRSNRYAQHSVTEQDSAHIGVSRFSGHGGYSTVPSSSPSVPPRRYGWRRPIRNARRSRSLHECIYGDAGLLVSSGSVTRAVEQFPKPPDVKVLGEGF
jgi:hypothetical protein